MTNSNNSPASLVTTLGVPALLQSVQSYLELHAQSSATRRAAIEDATVDFFAQDPAAAGQFLTKHHAQLLEKAPALLRDLYTRAYARCETEAGRDYLAQIARKHDFEAMLSEGYEGAASATTPARASTFTAAQRHAFNHLSGLAKLHFSPPQQTWGIRCRTNGFIVGASGTGKSHLMRELATHLGLEFMPVALSAWTPTGSRNGTPTLQLIRRQVAMRRKTLLFLDELEKFRLSDSTWSTSILGELLGLLEYQPGGEWRRAETKLLRESVWITAAATYQDLWTSTDRGAMGFGSPESSRMREEEVLRRIHADKWLPDELIYRLSDPPAILSPYTRADFQAICEAAGIPAGVVDLEAAVRSGMNMRALENAVSAHALASLRRKETSPHAHSIRKSPHPSGDSLLSGNQAVDCLRTVARVYVLRDGERL